MQNRGFMSRWMGFLALLNPAQRSLSRSLWKSRSMLEAPHGYARQVALDEASVAYGG